MKRQAKLNLGDSNLESRFLPNPEIPEAESLGAVFIQYLKMRQLNSRPLLS
jgi:hypothetical protein